MDTLEQIAERAEAAYLARRDELSNMPQGQNEESRRRLMAAVDALQIAALEARRAAFEAQAEEAGELRDQLREVLPALREAVHVATAALDAAQQRVDLAVVRIESAQAGLDDCDHHLRRLRPRLTPAADGQMRLRAADAY